MSVDPGLVRAWLAARSVARGLPQPVPDHGGWRVDTGSESERARYLFAGYGEGVGALGREIVTPDVFIKFCGTADMLRALLPERWDVRPSGWMMICDTDFSATPDVPEGYRIERAADGAMTKVSLFTPAGDCAASGFAAEHDGAFVYDRIVTAEPHRRKGLGRAVMLALASARRSPAAQQVLVATEAGRGLYARLGWSDHCPYATGVVQA